MGADTSLGLRHAEEYEVEGPKKHSQLFFLSISATRTCTIVFVLVFLSLLIAGVLKPFWDPVFRCFALFHPEVMHLSMLLVYNAPMPDAKNENTIRKN
jgi:hypothetical protein